MPRTTPGFTPAYCKNHFCHRRRPSKRQEVVAPPPPYYGWNPRLTEPDYTRMPSCRLSRRNAPEQHDGDIQPKTTSTAGTCTSSKPLKRDKNEAGFPIKDGN